MRNIFRFFLFAIVSICCQIDTYGNINSGNTTIKILRFDKDLYTYLQSQSDRNKKKLLDHYPILLSALEQTTTRQKDNKNTAALLYSLKTYYSHPSLIKLYVDELAVFDDMTLYEKQLTNAQKIFEKLFSDNKKFPQFAIHVSGLKENIIVTDNIISLSGDKYLGSNYEGYRGYFTVTEQEQMNPRFISRDYLKAWIISEKIIPHEEKCNLLSAMVEEGKRLFLLSKLLPDYKREDIVGYTSQEITLFNETEQTVWKNLMNDKTLLSTDPHIIAKYTDSSTRPSFSNPIYTYLPARMIGWKIVEAYAGKTHASVQDILKTNTNTILKMAKYKP